jgi:hypothetical protein
VDLELQHDTRNLARHRVTHATGVAQQDIGLQVVELFRINTLVGQHAKAGVDSVMCLTVFQRRHHDFP